ncbi:MAG TPA: hypothetical protein VKR32_04935 [Puia sp.]|nr:hypothetical protein [Puia sp.]
MTDQDGSTNRSRVSARFILVYVFILGVLFLVFISFADAVRFHRVTSGTISGLVLSLILGAVFWYFVMTMNVIEYDDVKCVLYVMDWKRKTEIQIPVEKIDKILMSLLGARNGSYVIVYRGEENQEKKIRLFPVPLSGDINTIITDTKLRNPNVIIRNWTIGWNEFFD